MQTNYINMDYFRIEKVIHYLEEHFQEQPGLEELADYLNLSPYHFQRLFKRWAGISPKRFLQFLTIEYAKKLLTEHHSVLDATYESGLSGPGRLHDLFVTIDAVTPGDFKLKGSGLQICYGIHPTPFGECLLAVTGRGVCGLSFITDSGKEEAVSELKDRWERAKLKQSPQKTKPWIDRIFHSDSRNDRDSISLFFKGTNFQIKVWEALLRIPTGFVCTYEDIASYIGQPKAARAVGNAVAINPIAYLIPCHRVIRKSGGFGKYGYGTARKKAMIGWEMAKRYNREAAAGRV